MSRDELLATLAHRRALGLRAEHRLARERRVIDRELPRLRAGEDAGVVLARLQAQGIYVNEEQEA